MAVLALQEYAMEEVEHLQLYWKNFDTDEFRKQTYHIYNRFVAWNSRNANNALCADKNHYLS